MKAKLLTDTAEAFVALHSVIVVQAALENNYIYFLILICLRQSGRVAFWFLIYFLNMESSELNRRSQQRNSGSENGLLLRKVARFRVSIVPLKKNLDFSKCFKNHKNNQNLH